MNELVRITEKDLVAVALRPLEKGSCVTYGGGEVTLLSDIPMGHKVALRDIKKNLDDRDRLIDTTPRSITEALGLG